MNRTPSARRPLRIMAIIIGGIVVLGAVLLWIFLDSGIVNR
ncbi:hypothetical protein [Pseudoxanthomonas suwonensis]|nr:hypothetical protein [Pseudoxanthomonas suwonensis]